MAERVPKGAAFLFVFSAALAGPLWREESVAVVVEARPGGWRVAEVGPAGALDPRWWEQLQAGQARAVVASGELKAAAEETAIDGEACRAYDTAEAAARKRLAAVAGRWAQELAARRTEEEGWLLDYYRRRLTEELRTLRRAVHQIAVLQVRIELAQRAVTLAQFRRELAGWQQELDGQLKAKRGVAARLAQELGRRYRELERRYQGEAKVTLVAAARLA